MSTLLTQTIPEGTVPDEVLQRAAQILRLWSELQEEGLSAAALDEEDARHAFEKRLDRLAARWSGVLAELAKGPE